MATISAALTIAIEHHQAGRLPMAEEIYRRILAVEPNHPDALHLLGLVEHQTGRQEQAIEHIGRAIEAHGTLRWVDVRRLPPSLTDVRWLPDATFRLTISGSVGADYTLQHATDLLGWTGVAMGTSPFPYTNQAPGTRARFYRAF